MQSSSKIRMFWRLYRNEMHKLLMEIIIFAILAVIINLFFYFKISGPAARDNGLILSLLDSNLLLFAFLIPFLASFRILNQEWSHHTIYLLLSLPASGCAVLGAKLAALFSQLLIGILTVGICGGILAIAKIPPNQQQLLYSALSDPRMSWAWLFFLSCITGMLALLCISFFSQVVGRLCRILDRLVTGFTFLATLYLASRLHHLAGMLLQPDSSFRFLTANKEMWAIKLHTMAPVPTSYMVISLLFDLLIAAAIFVAAAVIYDQRLEL